MEEKNDSIRGEILSFDFLDFIEGMVPATQILFKFIIFLMITRYTGMFKLASIILFVSLLIWIYPDIKQVIKAIIEGSK